MKWTLYEAKFNIAETSYLNIMAALVDRKLIWISQVSCTGSTILWCNVETIRCCYPSFRAGRVHCVNFLVLLGRSIFPSRRYALAGHVTTLCEITTLRENGFSRKRHLFSWKIHTVCSLVERISILQDRSFVHWFVDPAYIRRIRKCLCVLK